MQYRSWVSFNRINPALIDYIRNIYCLNEFAVCRLSYMEKFYDNAFVFCNLYGGQHIGISRHEKRMLN